MKKETSHTNARTFLAVFAIYCVAYTVQSQMTSFTLPTNNSDSGFKVIREDGTSVFAVDAEGTVTSDDDGLQVELPTNDNTSAFEVSKSNGTSAFKVSGNGAITGDGSGLSNVRPIAAYTGGNFSMNLSSSEQVVKSVTITVPSSGIIIVSVSGYAKWGSADYDTYRLSITTSSFLDYSYLSIGTDYGQSQQESKFAPISLLRTYSMGTGGTYTFNLVGDNPTNYAPFGNSVVYIEDVSMTAMYFPTGGTGAGKVALPTEEMEIQPGPGIDTPRI